jgi:hypothetical protein
MVLDKISGVDDDEAKPFSAPAAIGRRDLTSAA